MEALQTAIQDGAAATQGSESAISDTFDTKKADVVSGAAVKADAVEEEQQQPDEAIEEEKFVQPQESELQTHASKSDTGAVEAPTQTELSDAARVIVFEGELEKLSVKGVLKALAVKFSKEAVDTNKAFLKGEIKGFAQERVDAESNSKRKAEEKPVVAKQKKKKAKVEEKEEEEGEEEEEEDEADETGSNVDDLPTDIEVEVDISDFYRRNPSRSGRARTRAPPKKKPRKKKDPSDKPKKKTNTGFTKPMMLSDALAEFLGTGDELIPRTEVVKRITTYVKEHGLQSAKDGRKILFDEALQNVFKRKTSTFFQLQKHLTKHIFNPNDVC